MNVTTSEATWRENLIESQQAIDNIVREARVIAVLGIKPESRSWKPAFYVAEYLVQAGFDVIPVPVYYPEVTEILGQPVFRRLADIGRPIDIVDVFRRSEDLGEHVDDIIAAMPRVVWFQSGIRNEAVAERLARAGIRVVQDQCLKVVHEMLS